MEYNDQPWWKLEIKKFFLRLFLGIGTTIAYIIIVLFAVALIIKACAMVMEESIEKNNARRTQSSKIIQNKISPQPISTGKSWAQHGFSKINMEPEETFSGEPFTFDIWTAGMDEVDLLKTAKRNGINLFDEGMSYRYSTKLLNEYATVKLYLTAKTRKLMVISINWNSGRNVKGAILEMLKRQNAVSYGNVYKIDGRTEVELKSHLGIDLEMTYKDLALMQDNLFERKRKNDEERLDKIEKEGGKFFSQNGIKPQVQENNAEVYKITGQNGKIIYTNDPAKAAAQKASPVELKPLETVRLKELTGYVIYLKDGRTIDSKAASSDGRTVRFKEGKINIGMPVEKVDDVKGLYRAGNETSAKSLDFRGGF